MTDVELRLTANLDSATKEVAGFRKEYAEMVKAVEKPLRQVNATRALEQELEATGKSVRTARDRLKELQEELVRTDYPTEQLKQRFRDAGNELKKLERAEASQATQLSRMRAELSAAGVDTSRLVQEQRRLNTELNGGLAAGRKDAAVRGIRAQAAALAQVTREQRLANLEQAKADLGVSRYRALEAELGQVQSQYALLRRSGRLTNQELAVAQQAVTRRVRETKLAMRELVAEQQRVRSGAGALAGGLTGVIGGVGAAYATVAAVKGIAQQADAYNLMNARLKLATESQEEFTRAQAELRRIATETEAPLASLVTLYGRVSRPMKEAGRSQSEILKVTEAVATSFRVSGATAEEAQNGVIQFAQALGSGALRGDEFNSVAEQAPRLMQALADSIGVPTGALKDMAAEGQLTASVVSDALVSQLDVLRREAETLPETVGGAMTNLADRWAEAIGKADVGQLIGAINELAETVSDPEIVEGLVAIAGGMATLAGWTIKVASEFAKFADNVAFTAAQLFNGNDATAEQVRELEKLKRTLEEVNAARTGSSFIGSATVPLLMKLFAPEKLDAWADELSGKISEFEQRLYGLSQGEGAQQVELVSEIDAAREADLKSYAQYLGDLKALQAEQVKAVEKGAKALVSAEKKAIAELKKVRDERVKIEERYKEALAGLSGDGDASYGAAQSLKVGARQALQAGDIEGAQAKAQAALKMLQDLAEAGQSTYGFEGFIKELQAIELAANDIEQSTAQAKIDEIKASMNTLKEEAKTLENMPVSVKSDEASIEAVRSQIQRLAAELGNTEIVIPVRIAHPDGPVIKDVAPYSGDYVLQNPTPPGYASGGAIKGPGTGTSDSILARLSNGEFVVRAAAVRHYGPELLNQLNARRLPKFAEGGIVSNRSLPQIPQMSSSLLSSGSGSEPFGIINADFGGGERITVRADRDNFDKLLRIERRKRGSPTGKR